ncbi:hypothetical protein LJC48_05640 [Desulfovibrio sp. OttesenSCG-928-C06]|nr:hypothetical protein [Desulfovibrio sp. OttesenSCG-928-C06]
MNILINFTNIVFSVQLQSELQAGNRFVKMSSGNTAPGCQLPRAGMAAKGKTGNAQVRLRHIGTGFLPDLEFCFYCRAGGYQ